MKKYETDKKKSIRLDTRISLLHFHLYMKMHKKVMQYHDNDNKKKRNPLLEVIFFSLQAFLFSGCSVFGLLTLTEVGTEVVAPALQAVF